MFRNYTWPRIVSYMLKFSGYQASQRYWYMTKVTFVGILTQLSTLSHPSDLWEARTCTCFWYSQDPYYIYIIFIFYMLFQPGEKVCIRSVPLEKSIIAGLIGGVYGITIQDTAPGAPKVTSRPSFTVWPFSNAICIVRIFSKHFWVYQQCIIEGVCIMHARRKLPEPLCIQWFLMAALSWKLNSYSNRGKREHTKFFNRFIMLTINCNTWWSGQISNRGITGKNSIAEPPRTNVSH